MHSRRYQYHHKKESLDSNHNNFPGFHAVNREPVDPYSLMVGKNFPRDVFIVVHTSEGRNDQRSWIIFCILLSSVF